MSKWTTIATWDDAVHLTPEAKAEYLAAIPPHLRQARTKGVPHMGAGLVWPVEESSLRVSNFPLPHHWPRCYGFDTGWAWNAAVWLAWDKQSDVVYVHDCYKRGAAEPPINSEAIKARGVWIPGSADAADINRLDGKQYLEIYRNLGLDIELPDKALSTGLQNTWTRMSTGRLKIFESCTDLFDQIRTYMRNGHGDIPDDPRHDLCDALRYAIQSGLNRAKLPPVKQGPVFDSSLAPGSLAWMG